MHSKLAGHLPLQDMIANIIDEARTKIAADDAVGNFPDKKDDKKDEKKPPFFSKKDPDKKEKREKDEETEKKASILDFSDPEQIEKLASALESVGESLEKDADYIENGGEKRQGGGQLPVMSPVSGKQPWHRGGSRYHNIPLNTGLQTGDTGHSKTQIPNDYNDTPGGRAPMPKEGILRKKGVEKTAAESVMAKIQAAVRPDADDEDLDKEAEVTAEAKEDTKATHRPVFTPLQKSTKPRPSAEHEDKVEKNAGASEDKEYGRLAKGHGRLGAIAGGIGGTAHGAAGGALGTGAGYGSSRLNHYVAGKLAPREKKASAESSPVDFILDKMAGVYNGGEKTQGGMQLSNTAIPPNDPVRKLIRSNTAVIDATKSQVKAPEKKLLSQVLTEPAFSREHDPVVHDNLRNARKAGVKIAAARALLQKIAEEGCTCSGKGECKYCKMKDAKSKMEKASPAPKPASM